MKTKIVLIIFSTLVILSAVLFFPESSQCEFGDVILDIEMMPTGWDKQGYVTPPAIPKWGAEDVVSINYIKGPNKTYHRLYRYRNRMLAFIYLNLYNQYFFPTGMRSWSVYDEANKWALHGNTIRIKCGKSDSFPFPKRCASVIQYGPIISDFSSRVGDRTMSEEEFKEMVLVIDNHFSLCKKK